MTKNRSRMLIIFLSLVLIIGLVASFVSFTYPLSIGGVKYRYSSFANELVLGSDIGQGVLLEYKALIREGYEGDYDTISNPNPGHAATGGTYIIATPLSSIKHNFQVENINDFKVYVRVKDSRGLWSAWSQFYL